MKLLPQVINATFMRGGTSKGVFLLKSDLPPDESLWPVIFRKIMGSPCSHARQLNGMGGGISSLSKICVLSPSEEPSTVNFKFAQLGVKDGAVDYHGTCGNLMSAVPLFAIDEGLVVPRQREGRILEVLVNDINTSKTICTTCPGQSGTLDWSENHEISGVDGKGIKVSTKYLDCGGSKTGRLWPTGNVVDTLNIQGKIVEATLIDGPNPAVFCDAMQLGFADVKADVIPRDASTLGLLETIRVAGMIKMGIASSLAEAKDIQAIPKISLLSRTNDANGIRAITLSMGIVHKAIPMTIGLSLALAMATPGSIPHRLASGNRIYHPTGHVDVEAHLETPAGPMATVIRSARRLMKGQIYL